MVYGSRWVRLWGFGRLVACAALSAIFACSTQTAEEVPVIGEDLHPLADIAADTSAPTPLDAKPPVDATALPWSQTPDHPVLSLISPAQGSDAGGNVVLLTGLNLAKVATVRFGQSPALAVEVLTDELLRVTVPPRPSGTVDVTVVVPDREDAALLQGYRYIANVAITAVAPTGGPAGGGNVVTLTGTGFTQQSLFIFGEKLALAPVILDDHTAAVIAPPGSAGKVKIYAVNSDGTGVYKAGYTYHASPRVDKVEPAIGSVAGGFVLHLTGDGLLPVGATLQLHKSSVWLQAKIALADGAKLDAVMPAAPEPGSYDVIFVNEDGKVYLTKAFTYVDPASPPTKPELVSVVQNALPSNSLQAVDLGIVGPVTTKELAVATVTFGGKAANLQWSALDSSGANAGATLRVLPPATDAVALPHVVDIAVDLGGNVLKLAGSFTYLPPSAKITAISPTTLAAAGGTAVQIKYEAYGWGKAIGVKIGALSASSVNNAVPGVMTGSAPTGAPGSADVTLFFANGKTATLSKSVQFVSNQPMVAAVVPHVGAQSGGTYVSVVGSGLDKLQSLYFADRIVKSLEVVDSGLLHIHTPPGKGPGNATLYAYFTGSPPQTIADGFRYFDPVASDLGTWGDPIDGAVNITVLNKAKATPIAGASVILGDNLATPLQGKTDERGQITLSTKGLVGPVFVHANKIGFTAASVLALGVENVTIRLAANPPPPSNGAGAPAEKNPAQLPDGMLTGTVVDAEKYTVLPPGNCNGHDVVAGHCAICDSDSQCDPNTTCESMGSAPIALDGEGQPLPGEATGLTAMAHYCAASCATTTDCPSTFECVDLSKDLAVKRFRCVPRIGEPQIRCQSASPSIYGGSAANSDQGIVGADHKFAVAAHPGNQAVVCFSGYVDAITSEFVALSMGLVRDLNIEPGQKITNLKVHVQIPLNRQIRVRMDRVPLGPDADGMRTLTAALDIGAAGYVPMGTISTLQRTDVLTLERQPAATLFTGEGSDITYELYGGITSKYGSAPLSMAQATQLPVGGFDRWAVMKPGEKLGKEGLEAAGTLHALAERGNLRVAVGESGRISVWTGGLFTQQASPTGKNLTAVWLPPDSQTDGWIGSDDGQLLRRDALGWHLFPLALGVGVRSIAGQASNDAWLLDNDNQLHHWQGQAWQTVAGPLGKPPFVSGKNPQFVPPFPRQRALASAPDDVVFTAGDGGQVFRGETQAGKLIFSEINAWTTATIRVIVCKAADDVWLAGDRGYLGHYDGAVVTVFTTGVDRPLYGIRVGAGKFPVHVVGGQGTWVVVDGPGQVSDHSVPSSRVDYRGVVSTLDGGLVAAGEPILLMGPYLEMPYPLVPNDGGTLGQSVQWQSAPGLTPSFNLIRITDESYNTRWEIYASGELFKAPLPDFGKMLGMSPLAPGPARLRIWRIYSPSLSVDNFNSKLLSQYTWISWAYNIVSANVPLPLILPTAGGSAGPFGK